MEGDYKKPPPKGTFDQLYNLSKSLMSRDPVRIAASLRQFIADRVAEKLRADGIEVLIVSVDAKHVHLLARFPKHNPRMKVGYAKKYATQQLKAHGLAVGFQLEEGEGIWAKGCHAQPIQSRNHELKVFNYIRDHSKVGAQLWRFDRAPSPALR